jgi:formamidopyrimidine-DNA glycosylase
VPELPEMQALAERLEAAVAGAPLESLQALSFTGLKTVVPDPEVLVGAAVETVGRRGKYLVWSFAGGNRLLVHLSQGGRVDIEDPPKATKQRRGAPSLRWAPLGPGQGVRHRAQGPLVGAGRR